ncbi:hypothetical protein F4780DRAFT_775421 [Xylariomycetidae sp. FL0641]|nr:hypothetical protein F4780DRAFT_775421 [Xylariomycetidae sp. FL0641]
MIDTVKTQSQAGDLRKARPSSIDVKTAQEYKSLEELPDVEQGCEPKALQNITDKGNNDDIRPSIKEEAGNQTKRIPRKNLSNGKGEVRRRDVTTGRFLSTTGQACLRCHEKKLKCTLTFVGKESEPRCSACRRTGPDTYCVRLRSIDPTAQRPWCGPPWKNPNYITGMADRLVSAAELEELIKEHFLGRERYIGGCAGGETIREAATDHWALPGFTDLKTHSWRQFLPREMNRSQYPRQASTVGGDDVGASAVRDDPSLHSLPTPSTLALDEVEGEYDDEVEGEYDDESKTNPDLDDTERNIDDDIDATCEPEETEEDTLQYYRGRRKYAPRAAHLNEELGESW